mmetsp:Transcript_117771/g.380046  ORF Transcript_117771/g.380046 Transcript_117771/m.380046 type:complete len:373 (-) Transcript_117771:814-1932(-)
MRLRWLPRRLPQGPGPVLCPPRHPRSRVAAGARGLWGASCGPSPRPQLRPQAPGAPGSLARHTRLRAWGVLGAEAGTACRASRMKSRGAPVASRLSCATDLGRWKACGVATRRGVESAMQKRERPAASTTSRMYFLRPASAGAWELARGLRSVRVTRMRPVASTCSRMRSGRGLPRAPMMGSRPEGCREEVGPKRARTAALACTLGSGVPEREAAAEPLAGLAERRRSLESERDLGTLKLGRSPAASSKSVAMRSSQRDACQSSRTFLAGAAWPCTGSSGTRLCGGGGRAVKKGGKRSSSSRFSPQMMASKCAFTSAGVGSRTRASDCGAPLRSSRAPAQTISAGSAACMGAAGPRGVLLAAGRLSIIRPRS